MLPSLRFLAFSTALSTSALIFGLGAAALLRVTHQQLAQVAPQTAASQPVTNNIAAFDPAASEPIRLSLLRVEPEPAPTEAPSIAAPEIAEKTSAAPTAPALDPSEHIVIGPVANVAAPAAPQMKPEAGQQVDNNQHEPAARPTVEPPARTDDTGRAEEKATAKPDDSAPRASEGPAKPRDAGPTQVAEATTTTVDAEAAPAVTNEPEAAKAAVAEPAQAEPKAAEAKVAETAAEPAKVVETVTAAPQAAQPTTAANEAKTKADAASVAAVADARAGSIAQDFDLGPAVAAIKNPPLPKARPAVRIAALQQKPSVTSVEVAAANAVRIAPVETDTPKAQAAEAKPAEGDAAGNKIIAAAEPAAQTVASPEPTNAAENPDLGPEMAAIENPPLPKARPQPGARAAAAQAAKREREKQAALHQQQERARAQAEHARRIAAAYPYASLFGQGPKPQTR